MNHSQVLWKSFLEYDSQLITIMQEGLSAI